MKGSMDIAFLLSTVNHLRSNPNMVLMGLLILSLVLQVTSSILLVVEKMSEPMNYTKRKNINISITVMMILIIFISVLTTAFLDNPTL